MQWKYRRNKNYSNKKYFNKFLHFTSIFITIALLISAGIYLKNINQLHKTLIGAKPLPIGFDKVNQFLRIYDGTRYLVLLGGENIISFTTGLYIL